MTFNLKKNGGFFPVVLICLGLLISCRNGEEKDLDTGSKKADSLSIKLNSPELKAVNAGLLKEPGNAALYNKRARVYLSIQQLHEAVNDAKRAIRLDSTDVSFYHTLVDAYFAQNETRLSKNLLEIIEKKFPGDTEVYLKLAELYFLIKQYQKAIDYVNKALKMDESLAKGYFIKGSIYKESGDTARAISSLETAVEQDNRYEDAFYDLGVIYAARRNPIALEYYNNALKLNPASENIKYARAKLLLDLGKADEAVKEYEAILTKNKSCGNCYYNIGAIYLEIKKDDKEALEYFTKAIDADPGYLEAYFARGYTYAKLKDKESARADYKMCLKLKPNYEPALEGLNDL